MAGIIPAIHVYCCENKAWMPGMITPGITAFSKSGSL
jgi:hypothetical protein